VGIGTLNAAVTVGNRRVLPQPIIPLLVFPVFSRRQLVVYSRTLQSRLLSRFTVRLFRVGTVRLFRVGPWVQLSLVPIVIVSIGLMSLPFGMACFHVSLTLIGIFLVLNGFFIIPDPTFRDLVSEDDLRLIKHL
jgi:hypothetical protein